MDRNLFSFVLIDARWVDESRKVLNSLGFHRKKSKGYDETYFKHNYVAPENWNDWNQGPPGEDGSIPFYFEDCLRFTLHPIHRTSAKKIKQIYELRVAGAEDG